MNTGEQSAQARRRQHGEKRHQTEPFLAVFVDIDRQSLQKHDAGPVLQLGQQRVQDVNMRLGIYFLLDRLVESDDGVSYCALKCQKEVKNIMKD